LTAEFTSTIGFETGAIGALFLYFIVSTWFIKFVAAGNDRIDIALAVNFTLIWIIFGWIGQNSFTTRTFLQTALQVIALVSAVIGHVSLLRKWQESRREAYYVVCLWSPWVLLFAVKLLLPLGVLQMVGLSYICFRLSLLSLEIRKQPATILTIPQVLAHLLFPPTLSVGPINSFHNYRIGVRNLRWRENIPVSLARLLVGYAMFKFAAPVMQQVSYSSVLKTGQLPSVWTLAFAGYSYLFYLFFNFSGVCHFAIGTAGLAGFPVRENFNNPFLSRNIKDFWNRWHITLSELVRDMVFMPLNIWLSRTLPLKADLLATGVAAAATFMLIGLWHKLSLSMMIFGMLQGAAFMTYVAFDRFAKQRRWHRSAFLQSAFWTLFSQFMTISFIAASVFFMEMGELIDAVIIGKLGF
jgi:membrane protein involved in D-alanine export